MRRWLAEAARRYELMTEGRKRFPFRYDTKTGEHVAFESYNPFTDEVTYRIGRLGYVHGTHRKLSKAFNLYHKTFGSPA